MAVNKGRIFKDYINAENGCRIWESFQEKGTELIRVDSQDFEVASDISDLAKQLGFPRESWYEHYNVSVPYVSMVFDVGTYKNEVVSAEIWL